MTEKQTHWHSTFQRHEAHLEILYLKNKTLLQGTIAGCDFHEGVHLRYVVGLCNVWWEYLWNAVNENVGKWTLRENNAADICSFHLPSISLGKLLPKHSVLVEQFIRGILPPLLYWPRSEHIPELGQSNSVLWEYVSEWKYTDERWLALSYTKAIL